MPIARQIEIQLQESRLQMKIAVSQISTMPTPLIEDLPAFAAAGFTAVELSLEKVGRYLADHSVEQLNELLALHGLEATGAIGLAPSGPSMLLSRGDGWREYLRSFERQVRLAQSLGAQQIGIGADAARWVGEEDWLPGAIDNLREAADLSQNHGVRIGLEFMSLDEPIGPFVLSSLEQTRRVVDAVEHPAVGINIDYFHHYRSGGSVAELASVPAGQIVGVHVTDLNGRPRNLLGDADRELPGEGILPLKAYRDAIESTGFDGVWVLELLNERIWQLPIGQAADALMKSTSRM